MCSSTVPQSSHNQRARNPHPLGDTVMWQTDLKPHANFSITDIQANRAIEDQGQVVTSPAAMFVGVYDGHGGPEASSFISSWLFPHLHGQIRAFGVIMGLENDCYKLMKIMLKLSHKYVHKRWTRISSNTSSLTLE